MSLEDRRRRSRQAKLGLTAVAGGVGAGIGASKLRDAYREDYPERFARHVDTARRVATARRGVQAGERVAHTLEHGKPHFTTLLIASGAGTLAAGADYYHDHLTHEARARQRREDATGVRKDAFGVNRPDLIGKSYLGNGQYKPANQLNHGDRQAVRATAMTRGRGSGVGRGAPRTNLHTHGADALYSQHVFGQVAGGPRALMDESSVPSPGRKNIHYGASIAPEHHAALDEKIDPEQAAKLRHPVVFHHERLTDGGEATAGAVGAHVTTGHRGHVVLNADQLNEKGDVHPEIEPYMHSTPHEMIAHELHHAALRTTNPIKWSHHAPEEMARRSFGEEARADTLSMRGKGSYMRAGMVPPKKASAQAAKITPRHVERSLARNGMTAEDIGESSHDLAAGTRAGARAALHYHTVRDRLRSIGMVKKSASVSPFGVDHGVGFYFA